MTARYDSLMLAADAAAKRAYAPYSHFHVGAALLAKDGSVFPGCNVENSSYGLTNCAERTAIYSAVAAGNREFAAIAISQGGESEAPCWPCGACRQVLAEFNPEMDVVLKDGAGTRVLPLSALLPHAFTPQRLTVM